MQPEDQRAEAKSKQPQRRSDPAADQSHKKGCGQAEDMRAAHTAWGTEDSTGGSHTREAATAEPVEEHCPAKAEAGTGNPPRKLTREERDTRLGVEESDSMKRLDEGAE